MTNERSATVHYGANETNDRIDPPRNLLEQKTIADLRGCNSHAASPRARGEASGCPGSPKTAKLRSPRRRALMSAAGASGGERGPGPGGAVAVAVAAQTA